jgi:hypothetical protein
MEEISRDTVAWRFQVWASFLIASAVTVAGVLYLPVDHWMRAFLMMGILFTVGSCFSLAKTLRDDPLVLLMVGIATRSARSWS